MDKLVIIWDTCGEEKPRFMVVSASDFNGLNGVYINAYTKVKSEKQNQERLMDLMYDKEGNFKHEILESFPVEVVRAGAGVIVCGFLP